MSKKYVVMFVCTGNTCRSPMAEGALRTLLSRERPGKFEVFSSGTATAQGFPATDYAIEAARVWDCDISGHLSQPLTPAAIDKADLILCMTPRHAEAVLIRQRDVAGKTYLLKGFPDADLRGEGVEDPIGQSLDQYNRTFLELGEYLGKYLAEIVRRIDEKTNA